MGGYLLGKLVSTGNHSYRNLTRWAHRCDGHGFPFEHSQTIGHRGEAFRLAPQLLDYRVNVGRELPYFANKPLERTRGRGAKDFDEPSRYGWRTAAQESQACADDTNLRKQRAYPRRVTSAWEQADAFRRHRQPLGRWIDEHKAEDPCCGFVSHFDLTFRKPNSSL
jgi:hypothetical protein